MGLLYFIQKTLAITNKERVVTIGSLVFIKNIHCIHQISFEVSLENFVNSLKPSIVMHKFLITRVSNNDEKSTCVQPSACGAVFKNQNDK